MPRIPEISAKEQLPEDQRHVWDEIAGSRGSVQGPFRLLLHQPEIAGRVAHVGTYFRFEGSLDPALRELAIISTARAMDCVYIFAVHQAAAKAAGVSQAAITAVDQHRPDELGLVSN